MNRAAVRRFAIGAILTVLLSAAAVAAVAGSGASLGWSLLGWSMTGLTGLAGVVWVARRLGSLDARFSVALWGSMLLRLAAAAAGAAAVVLAGPDGIWAYTGGMIAGLLPLQAYEIGWFCRRRLHAN